MIKFENNKFFIQLSDIRFLTNMHMLSNDALDEQLPEINNKNRYDFIEIKKPGVVAFIRNFDFILNYHEYAHLSIEEIESKYIFVSKAVIEMVLEINTMSEKQKINNRGLIIRYEEMFYKQQAIWTILFNKRNNSPIDQPPWVNNVNRKENDDSPIDKFVKRLIGKFRRKNYEDKK